MLKRVLLRCLTLTIVLQFCLIAFRSAPIASASSVQSAATTPKIVTTEYKSISPDRCLQIKKAFPGHDSDPNACVVTITHTIVGSATLLSRLDSKTMRLRPNASNSSCTSGGATASAYDDLKYSYMWIEELYTRFQYSDTGCIPTLVRNNGYAKYAIVGLSDLEQSTTSYTQGTMVTAVENIVSKNGVLGWGTQFSSCQSRGFDGYGDWPYYSNLLAQDC